MSSLSSIYIYKCDKPPEYNLEEIIDYLREKYYKARIEPREDFFSLIVNKANPSNLNNLAQQITLCRVHNLNKEVEEFTPLPLEIDYEKKRLLENKQLKGIIYDGFKFQVVCREFIKPEEQILSSCHIILTNQLLASFDKNDKRYHLRVGIYGSVNIISTSGIIEALAKPKEYYLKLQMGLNPLDLNNEFKTEIIDYKDERITELLKGYCLQAMLYQMRGELFCEHKNCRLYNAHWQRDALYAQIESQPEFCPRHLKILSQL